jgi:hypothetical protein
MNSFDGIMEVNFECPNGVIWDVIEPQVPDSKDYVDLYIEGFQICGDAACDVAIGCTGYKEYADLIVLSNADGVYTDGSTNLSYVSNYWLLELSNGDTWWMIKGDSKDPRGDYKPMMLKSGASVNDFESLNLSVMVIGAVKSTNTVKIYGEAKAISAVPVNLD